MKTFYFVICRMTFILSLNWALFFWEMLYTFGCHDHWNISCNILDFESWSTVYHFSSHRSKLIIFQISLKFAKLNFTLNTGSTKLSFVNKRPQHFKKCIWSQHYVAYFYWSIYRCKFKTWTAMEMVKNVNIVFISNFVWPYCDMAWKNFY